MMIRTVFWKNNTVVMIDQKALPLTERQVVCSNYRQVIAAIKDLTVRGAPAIGVTAAMGAALGAQVLAGEPSEKFQKKFNAICDEIAKARPTARNLFWALERMKQHLDDAILSGKQNLAAELVKEAKRICAEDININRQMGRHGSKLFTDGDNILTHCNAGALATAGYGTALGVIRAACEQGKKLHIYVDETRPVLQGARLTAWEMKKEKIPATLITDNMAGFLMQQGKIDKIIVGADRIAANGDTANKIGTYSLAVLAKAHRIPFYIAAPLSTFDFSLKTGAAIPIEERQADEVTCFRGVQAAPRGTKVYNPAFDVTPSKLISAIITEKGILTRPIGRSIARLRKGII
ncbi:MAG: S-methyl-5-thioribose-1-phosphate isomerase [Smithellaceae bacterium]|nr:S-methyl-5-thioribose-1-phosphate isomerase [Smithellaceae bacterium]